MRLGFSEIFLTVKLAMQILFLSFTPGTDTQIENAKPSVRNHLFSTHAKIILYIQEC